MRKLMSVVMVAGVMAAGAVAFGRDDAKSSAAAGSFKVDPVHSMVVFGIGHLGVSRVYGTFSMPTGTFLIDAAEPSKSFIDISVETEKVNTGAGKRDDHLRSPDFFNAKEFPKMTFKSSSFEKGSGSSMMVKGDLTMIGETRPVTVSLEWLGEGNTAQGHKAGFEATFTIKRSEFGMTKYLEGDAIGDEVKLTVAIEGKRE
ncbi:MAG: YceI family protein [Phycisphaerae bacterium]|nr:YceI family protein [Phycisphaerae bacterium]